MGAIGRSGVQTNQRLRLGEFVIVSSGVTAGVMTRLLAAAQAAIGAGTGTK